MTFAIIMLCCAANATTKALDEAFAASSLDAVCQVVFAVSDASADDPETRGTLVSALGSATAWVAQHKNQDQWMIIDLGERMSVQGIIVSGRNGGAHGQKVTRVRVEVADGADGPWTECGEHECRVVQHNDEKRIVFDAAVAGRHVKLSPRVWEQHISMRCGVITLALPEM